MGLQLFFLAMVNYFQTLSKFVVLCSSFDTKCQKFTGCIFSNVNNFVYLLNQLTSDYLGIFDYWSE